MTSFENAFDDIEAGLAKIESNFDPQVVHDLFRAIHSIKGNAAMVHIDVIVDYTHKLESVFSRLRDGTLDYGEKLSEALHVGMDRLRDLHHQEIMQVQFETLDIGSLGTQFEQLSEAQGAQIDGLLNQILGLDATTADTPSEPNADVEDLVLDEAKRKDLNFFKSLAVQLDKLCKYWSGRSVRTLELAHKLNQLGGRPVPDAQMSAACYLHDIGMSFVPPKVIDYTQKLDADQHAEIEKHPDWGYQLASRMSGWDEAANIILQHHEHVDGRGYPARLKGDDIHPGAKILAIIDAYLSMTMGRADHVSRKGALRAISEINARKNTQFDGYWVDQFNQLLKQEIREGRL